MMIKYLPPDIDTTINTFQRAPANHKVSIQFAKNHCAPVIHLDQEQQSRLLLGAAGPRCFANRPNRQGPPIFLKTEGPPLHLRRTAIHTFLER